MSGAHSAEWIINTYYKDFNARGSLCEICGERPWTDPHHCLIHGMKKYPQLDVPENIQLVCRSCHNDGPANSNDNRVLFWNMQCQRYGRRHMRDWIEYLPLKIKPIYGDAYAKS
jgi:hypothetical protein